MAREKQAARHASTKPSEAQRGGTIGIPSGAVATITEAQWVRWEEAGESAIKGGRSADDPALKIVADVEGAEEPIVEFLGAGKQLVPGDDGEFLDIPAGSSAVAISDSCNANIFLKSVSDEKRHKKNAVDEDLMDGGISAFLQGLKFVAGREVIKREGLEDSGGRTPRPTLVCDEIIEGPGSGKKGGSSKSSPKAGGGKAKVQTRSEVEPPPDEDEDEPEDADLLAASDNETAEGYVLQALELPKWKKGIPVKNAFVAVFNLVRGEDAGTRETVTEKVRDKDWLEDEGRPWAVEDGVISGV